jgi:hypothetical protein
MKATKTIWLGLYITLALLAPLIFMACVTTARMEQNTIYYQDPRTSQCFAFVTLYVNGHWNTTMTYVPCTPEVLTAVETDRGK